MAPRQHRAVAARKRGGSLCPQHRAPLLAAEGLRAEEHAPLLPMPRARRLPRGAVVHPDGCRTLEWRGWRRQALLEVAAVGLLHPVQGFLPRWGRTLGGLKQEARGQGREPREPRGRWDRRSGLRLLARQGQAWQYPMLLHAWESQAPRLLHRALEGLWPSEQ